MDKIAKAQEILQGLADEETNEKVTRLVESGKAKWEIDPVVENVVGLLEPGTNRAYLVVYLSLEDFETSEDFETAGDEERQTILLGAGSVEYDRAEAEVSIADLIASLEQAQQDGATHVVMASGNYRGAQYQRLSTDWSWDDEEGGW